MSNARRGQPECCACEVMQRRLNDLQASGAGSRCDSDSDDDHAPPCQDRGRALRAASLFDLTASGLSSLPLSFHPEVPDL